MGATTFSIMTLGKMTFVIMTHSMTIKRGHSVSLILSVFILSVAIKSIIPSVVAPFRPQISINLAKPVFLTQHLYCCVCKTEQFRKKTLILSKKLCHWP
jgi:hypothetical protein